MVCGLNAPLVFSIWKGFKNVHACHLNWQRHEIAKAYCFALVLWYGDTKTYYSTDRDNIQIWSQRVRLFRLFCNKLRLLYIVIYVLYDETILMMMNLSCGISTDSNQLGLWPRGLSIRRYFADFRKIIVTCFPVSGGIRVFYLVTY